MLITGKAAAVQANSENSASASIIDNGTGEVIAIASTNVVLQVLNLLLERNLWVVTQLMREIRMARSRVSFVYAFRMEFCIVTSIRTVVFRFKAPFLT